MTNYAHVDKGVSEGIGQFHTQCFLSSSLFVLFFFPLAINLLIGLRLNLVNPPHLFFSGVVQAEQQEN